MVRRQARRHQRRCHPDPRRDDASRGLRRGTYLLLTTVATASGIQFIVAKNGVSIIGEGRSSVLRVGNNIAGSWYVIYPAAEDTSATVSGVEYRNFLVDCNGANNNAP